MSFKINIFTFKIHKDCTKLSLKLQDDMEAEMRRLKQELKQTMNMYSTACKEALTAKQKVLNRSLKVLKSLSKSIQFNNLSKYG